MRSLRRGFSLIEAVVAIALLTIGVAAAVGALGRLTRAEVLMQERILLTRLAQEKMNELLATGDLATAPIDGDFADRERSDIRWSVSLEPSGVENLERVTLTVEGGAQNLEQTMTMLWYRAPQTTGAAP